MFSGAATEFGSEPNSQVSLIDAAMPGMLPVLNKYCVEQAIKTGLAINAKINKISIFDRKTIFYADLPQRLIKSPNFICRLYRMVTFRLKPKMERRKRLELIEFIWNRTQEGKSMLINLPDCSLIDLNRSGIALMEIVTEPDLSSPYEAAEYVKNPTFLGVLVHVTATWTRFSSLRC